MHIRYTHKHTLCPEGSSSISCFQSCFLIHSPIMSPTGKAYSLFHSLIIDEDISYCPFFFSLSLTFFCYIVLPSFFCFFFHNTNDLKLFLHCSQPFEYRNCSAPVGWNGFLFFFHIWKQSEPPHLFK